MPHTPRPSRKQLTDAWLVLEAQAGQRDSLRLLAERWQQRLWRHAYHVTQREDLAWDVSQEAWLVIARSLGRLREPERFGSWALSIITRRALDTLRRRARVGSLEDPEQAVPAPETGPDSGNDEAERVRQALAQLPPEQRALLALHHGQDVPLEHLAQDLAIPLGTVKSRLHTARQALRETLKRNEP